MLHGLEHRIFLLTLRRRFFRAKPRPYAIQCPPHFTAQSIEGFLSEGNLVRSLLQGTPLHQGQEVLPKPEGTQCVAGQDLCQKQGEGAPTASSFPTIGTKYPLAALKAPLRYIGIVAKTTAVPVQCSMAAAVWTWRLLEGKSALFNS